MLSFSQYVVGGLLATSFLQEQLSKGVVGFLGLVVVASSIIRQHYRPELRYADARRRHAMLRRLLFQAQDRIDLGNENPAIAVPRHQIRRALAEGLQQVADHALQDELVHIQTGVVGSGEPRPLTKNQSSAAGAEIAGVERESAEEGQDGAAAG